MYLRSKFMNKTLYLIDRNVMILMRNHTQGYSHCDISSQKNLRLLKDKDIINNTFSPLFSIIEGKGAGSKMPHKKIRSLIKEEATVVAQFFEKAKTDAFFLIRFEKHIAKMLYEQEHDGFLNEKLRYLDTLRRSLSTLSKVEQRHNAYEIFKNISASFTDFKNQPFTLVCLMFIFGSVKSSNLLKFSKKSFNAYNAIADFNHIKILNKLRFSYPVLSENYDLKFISFDKDIEFIDNLFFYSNSKNSSFSNFTYLNKQIWQPDVLIIESEIPDLVVNGVSNKEVFYTSFKDFYGYDLRNNKAVF